MKEKIELTYMQMWKELRQGFFEQLKERKFKLKTAFIFSNTIKEVIKEEIFNKKLKGGLKE